NGGIARERRSRRAPKPGHLDAHTPLSSRLAAVRRPGPRRPGDIREGSAFRACTKKSNREEEGRPAETPTRSSKQPSTRHQQRTTKLRTTGHAEEQFFPKRAAVALFAAFARRTAIRLPGSK